VIEHGTGETSTFTVNDYIHIKVIIMGVKATIPDFGLSTKRHLHMFSYTTEGWKPPFPSTATHFPPVETLPFQMKITMEHIHISQIAPLTAIDCVAQRHLSMYGLYICVLLSPASQL
jgi:hypothetical protein